MQDLNILPQSFRHDPILSTTTTTTTTTVPPRATMQISAALQKKITKAVETSMRIEGYQPKASKALRERAKTLMEQRNVQVSVPRK